METFEWKYLKGRRAFFLKLALFIIVMVIDSYWNQFFEMAGINEHRISAILFFLAGNLIVIFCRFLISYFYVIRRKKLDANKDNFLFGLMRISSIINFIIFVISIFIFFNIDFIKFFTSISIIAAAIAILSKDYISNMINGMIIMFNDEVMIGDYIKINEHRGTIIDITFINVHLLDDNGDIIYFPNSMMLTEEVTNFTRRGINKVNIHFEMDIQHLKNVDELESYLIECLKPFYASIKSNSFFLRTVTVKKDQIDFSFQYIIKRHDLKLEKEIRKMVMRNLVEFISRKKEQEGRAEGGVRSAEGIDN